MRWLTYILPLYILVLGVMPCTDQLTTQIPTDMEHSESEPQNHGHREHDTCTPFCSCSCCGAHISQVPFFSYENPEQPLIYQLTVLAFTKHSPVSEYKGSIWQPPRIAV